MFFNDFQECNLEHLPLWFMNSEENIFLHFRRSASTSTIKNKENKALPSVQYLQF